MSSKLFSLGLEELTYLYETLYERSASNVDSNKEKRVCKKVMAIIEETILEEEEKPVDKQES